MAQVTETSCVTRISALESADGVRSYVDPEGFSESSLRSPSLRERVQLAEWRLKLATEAEAIARARERAQHEARLELERAVMLQRVETETHAAYEQRRLVQEFEHTRAMDAIVAEARVAGLERCYRVLALSLCTSLLLLVTLLGAWLW